MSEYIPLDCVKLNQNDHDILLFKISAVDLLDIAIFKPREEDRETGIQRDWNVSRSKEIAEYIDGDDAVIPNNIIINIKSDNLYTDNGKLCLRKIKSSVFVIDGQHRLRAFAYANKKDFELPVAAFIDLTWAEIAEIFVKINYYQKSVNKSLVYDLLGISSEIFPDFKEAHSIVQVLNDSMNSPWFGLIKMLGIGKGVITQATFINALTKYKILDEVLKDFSTSEKALILTNYFDAIKNSFVSEWGNKTSIISKSIGFHAFMSIFPSVFKYITTKHESFESSVIEEYLMPIRSINLNDSDIKGLGGMSGVKRFTQIITEKLEEKWQI